MNANEIKWVQVENTTKCNAWCPGCGRNQRGFGLRPGLVIEDLNTQKFEEILKLFPNLQVVQFCGTYGDFAAAKNVLEHVDVAISLAKKIQIHTHGGIRNKQWWKQLAQRLASIDHDVWFAIDGIKGIHEIYRQGTDYDKVIKNAKAFIENGGSATWQFIPWEHNEHVLKDCMALSQKMGFKKFKLVKNVRTNFSGRHWRSGEPIEFKPWSLDNRFNRLVVPIKNQVVIEDCMHLNLPSVYVNANGNISPCCYFNHLHAVDYFTDLPDLTQSIPNKPQATCLHFCGSHAKITQ